MKSTVQNTMKTMKLALGAVACALLILALSVAPAWAAAGDPASGLDL